MKMLIKSRYPKKLAIIFLLLLFGQVGNAAVFLYTDRNEFESALSEFNIIDFNDIYQRPLRDTTIEDATFSTYGNLYSRIWNGSNAIADENGGTIIITLNADYKAIGFDIGFLYDRLGALGQYTLAGTSGILSSNTGTWDEKLNIAKSGSFFGWISSDDYITELEIYVYIPSVPAWPIIDNVTIGNPIPESIITVLAPNDGEELTASTTHEITWTSEGEIDDVTIEYSVNDGAGWTEIVASTYNDGSYNWEVPCDLSDESLIKISDVDSNASDTSDAVFFKVDTDSDGVCGDIDNCPEDYNPEQLDYDEDGIGDVCDEDADDDGFTFDNDCDDFDSNINPDACDIKKDGIDQNCDGFDRTRGNPMTT